MVASGFLPVAFYKNKLYFLFGKEAFFDRSPGFSDFGGGIEKNETNIYNAGLREFAEETTGFFGGPEEINKMVKKNGGVYKLQFNDYHIHIFRLEYDDNLVNYYNNSHKFIYDRMNHKQLQKTCIFEKIEINWMTVSEMRNRRREFRHFYQEILDMIIGELPNIKEFICSRKIR